MHRPAGNRDWANPLGDEDARLDRRPRRRHRRPAAVLEAALVCEVGVHLDEHLRLQLRQVRDPAGHSARRVLLGQAIRRRDVREQVGTRLAAGGVVRVLRQVVLLPPRVGAL